VQGAPLAQRAMKEVATRTAGMASIDAVRFGETIRLVVAATDDAHLGGPDRRGR
jgi:E-phenylitaconyl-CoA hydratase